MRALASLALLTALLLALSCSDPADDGDAGNVDPVGDHDTSPSALAHELSVCTTGQAYTTIGAAIAAAHAGDTIDVCSGTYRERLVIAKSLYLRGAGAATTTIDGQGGGTTVTVQGSAAKVVLEGFTITGGASPTAGGGLRCAASTLTVAACVLVGNRAAGGGGLYASMCGLDVHDTVFAQNEAGLAAGGGALLASSTGSVHACRFDANHAEHGGGLAEIEGNVSILDSELDNNHASTQGGGLWLASSAEVARVDVHDNQSGWTGGGVYVSEHAPLVHDSEVHGNASINDGAGLYLHRGKTILRANRITANSAGDDAGGVRIFESQARLEANVIEDNVANDGGGGIKVSHVPSTFVDNVIRRNRAGTGGGVMMDNDASTVTGGEVSDNTASGGGGFYIDLAPWTGAHLAHVRIAANHAWIGGGIMMTGNFMPVVLEDLTIVDNTATNVGGAILARGSEYHLDHSLVARNTGLSGGGIYHGVPDPYTDPCPCPMTTTVGRIRFSVLATNRATDGSGSAIFAQTGGLTVEDSILYGHDGTAVQASAAPVWRYNDTQPATFSGIPDPAGANGNLTADPRFVDAVHGNFHLAPGSACIDAGDPSTHDPDGSRADLGLYGGTP
jgi:nitrous oxidase accessory protein NosD